MRKNKKAIEVIYRLLVLMHNRMDNRQTLEELLKEGEEVRKRV